jgi:hypothetical protein
MPNTPEEHKLEIARRTLQMPDAIAGVMGGPTKAEGRETLGVKPELAKLNLEQVNQQFRNGQISEDEAKEYVRAWNAGPHITQAVIFHGEIENFDPETSNKYRHLYDEFGVKL